MEDPAGEGGGGIASTAVRTRGFAGRAIGLAPLLLPLFPKCPLCLLPLFAAAGAALPPAPILNGLVAVSAAAWLGVVLSTARWPPVRAAAVAAAALLVAGRLGGPAWATAAGAALVLAVVFWTGRRPRACTGRACGVNRELLSSSASASQSPGVRP